MIGIIWPISWWFVEVNIDLMLEHQFVVPMKSMDAIEFVHDSHSKYCMQGNQINQ